jgi:hypothetical protein
MRGRSFVAAAVAAYVVALVVLAVAVYVAAPRGLGRLNFCAYDNGHAYGHGHVCGFVYDYEHELILRKLTGLDPAALI